MEKSRIMLAGLLCCILTLSIACPPFKSKRRNSTSKQQVGLASTSVSSNNADISQNDGKMDFEKVKPMLHFSPEKLSEKEKIVFTGTIDQRKVKEICVVYHNGSLQKCPVENDRFEVITRRGEHLTFLAMDEKGGNLGHIRFRNNVSQLHLKNLRRTRIDLGQVYFDRDDKVRPSNDPVGTLITID